MQNIKSPVLTSNNGKSRLTLKQKLQRLAALRTATTAAAAAVTADSCCSARPSQVSTLN